jgi:hypothetical protein
MQIEKLQHKKTGPCQDNELLPCFRCHGMEATHRVTMAIGKHGGKLMVCLCESCSQMPETELYAHFVGGGSAAYLK